MAHQNFGRSVNQLSQPGGIENVHHITTAPPPGFSDFPTALMDAMQWQRYNSGQSQANQTDGP